MSLFDINIVEYYCVTLDNEVFKKPSKTGATQMNNVFAIAELQIGTTPGSSVARVPYKKLIIYGKDGTSELTCNGYTLHARYCFQGEGDGMMQIGHFNIEIVDSNNKVIPKDYKLSPEGIRDAVEDFKAIAQVDTKVESIATYSSALIPELKAKIASLTDENKLLKKKIRELANFAKKL